VENFFGLFIVDEISQDAIIATDISHGTGITGNDHVKNISTSTDITSTRGSLLKWQSLHP
jgi:hypothetical protein